MTTVTPGFFQGTEMPTSGWWKVLWSDPAGILAAVGLTSGTRVIDLCSGDGWFTLHIAKVAHHVTAIDIDPDLLDMARRRLAEHGITNADFLAGDAYQISKLVQEPAELVFMANAFHGVPNQPRLSLAVRASLKPGGRFVIINWHQRSREETIVLGEPRGPKTELRLSPEQTIEAVEASGLKLVHVVEVPPFHYGAIFENPSV